MAAAEAAPATAASAPAAAAAAAADADADAGAAAGGPSAAVLSAPTLEATGAETKVIVVFRAAGGAPILAQPKVKVSLDSKFSKLVAFLRRQLDRNDGVVRFFRRAARAEARSSRRPPPCAHPHPTHTHTHTQKTPTNKQFVYLREAFCPALDDEVGVLARAYGVDGGGPGRPRELHVSYALVPAWG
jgi:hypothetical protein